MKIKLLPLVCLLCLLCRPALASQTEPPAEAAAAPVAEDQAPVFSEEELAKYVTLKAPMSHPTVSLLKQRLFELGYYRNNVVNDRYTEDTARFFKQFQKASGLKEDGIATPEQQALFHSDFAVPNPTPTPRPTVTPRPTPTPLPTSTPYVEPAHPLAIGQYAYADLQGDRLWFNPEVVNLSRRDSVTSFTLTFYARDGQGQPIPRREGESLYTSAFIDKPVAAGRTVNAGETLLEDYPGIQSVYVAVTAYAVEDGETTYLPSEEWEFAAWTLR